MNIFFRYVLALSLIFVHSHSILPGCCWSRIRSNGYDRLATLESEEASAQQLYTCIQNITGEGCCDDYWKECAIELINQQEFSQQVLDQALLCYVTRKRDWKCHLSHFSYVAVAEVLLAHGANLHCNNDKLLMDSIENCESPQLFDYWFRKSRELKQPYRLITFLRLKQAPLRPAIQNHELSSRVLEMINVLSFAPEPSRVPRTIEYLAYDLSPDNFVVQPSFVEKVSEVLANQHHEKIMLDDIIGAILETRSTLLLEHQ